MEDNIVSAMRRLVRGIVTAAAIGTAFAALAPSTASAQVLLPANSCDFDIADHLGRNMTGSTLRLTGRPDAPTDVGEFYIINGNTPESDVDKDGYDPTCPGFNKLFIQQRAPLVNLTNGALAIPGANIVVNELPRRLGIGQQAQVQVFVEIPRGTVAGRYVGFIEIRDDSVPARATPTNDVLNRDYVYVEVTVSEQTGFTVLDPDEETPLDSVVLRGRTGARVSAAFRLANAGNTNLRNLQLSATDLRSESAVNLVIPSENVQFSTATIAGLELGDTARVTVTVNVPRGILGGRYRGLILVNSDAGPAGQAGGAASSGNTRQEIPIIVIVQSNRGILFANNPVRSSVGDVAQIAFNGDPGTTWQLMIFDMQGLTVFRASGSVFAGVSPASVPGTVENPQAGADFAVNSTWALINGRGEQVASGMYLVVVESFVNGQRVIARDRLMVIR